MYCSIVIRKAILRHIQECILIIMSLSSYCCHSNLSAERMLYTDADLQASMDRIETVNFHQEVDLNGIRFSCFHAGHVLGACMFLIEIAGVKVGRQGLTGRAVIAKKFLCQHVGSDFTLNKMTYIIINWLLFWYMYVLWMVLLIHLWLYMRQYVYFTPQSEKI